MGAGHVILDMIEGLMLFVVYFCIIIYSVLMCTWCWFQGDS